MSDSMPYWLKGAILGLSFSFLVGSPLLIFFEGTFEAWLSIPLPTFMLFIFAFMDVTSPTIWELTKVYALIIITSAIVWFLAGSLIGLIYGQIKAGRK